jgi:S-formylglutathione hydrolase FrmB
LSTNSFAYVSRAKSSGVVAPGNPGVPAAPNNPNRSATEPANMAPNRIRTTVSTATKPGLFRSVAVYSGISQTSDPVGQQMVKATVELWGGGNTENMWGTLNSQLWTANDPTVNAEKLRGTNLFISTGNGIPGAYDAPGGKFRMEPPEQNAPVVAIGSVIEAGVNWSTHNLNARLDKLKIPATFVYRDSGTHSWGYWQDDLKASWPVLAQGLLSTP